jgi:predicted nucleotidyltransferase
MRRFSLMLDEELYEALSRQAAAEGVSRAELLRRFARERGWRPPPRSPGSVRTVTAVEMESLIPEIVERLRPFDPVRIYLFGSQARGDANDGSDLDLLVVLPEVGDASTEARAMDEALRGIGVSYDLWAADTASIERTGDNVGSFLYPVLREGRVIYGMDDRDAATWLGYAEEDLGVAKRMTSERGWTPRIACFHAQQAAEKVEGSGCHRRASPCLHEQPRTSAGQPSRGDSHPAGRVRRQVADALGWAPSVSRTPARRDARRRQAGGRVGSRHCRGRSRGHPPGPLAPAARPRDPARRSRRPVARVERELDELVADREPGSDDAVAG